VNAYVSLKNISKTYTIGEIEIEALKDVSFEADHGEFVIIVGESGAGKTTLLNILGGMDTTTSGHLMLDGIDITHFSKKQLTTYRRFDIGFVFQFYNLIPNLTALENIELVSEMSPEALDANMILDAVGLSKRQNNFPAQLSGGEQQRVAIARALAKNPKLLLCDEPTGALDYETGKQILRLLKEMCRKNKMTVVVITHNQAIAPIADRILKIKNGRILANQKNPDPQPIDTLEW